MATHHVATRACCSDCSDSHWRMATRLNLPHSVLGRLVVKDEKQAERMQAMGIKDHNKIYTTKELAPGKNVLFAACGVTDGNLLKGVRFFGDGIRTQSIVMSLNPARVRFIDTVHLENRPEVKVRFQWRVIKAKS